MYRRFSSILLLTVLLLITAAPAFAAERAPINPPGWVGGLIVLLAISLAVATGLWVRSK